MTDATANLKRWMINGVAITIPLVITLIVLSVVLGFLLDALSPVVSAVIFFWPTEPPVVIVQLATLLTLVGLLLLIGFVADHTPGERISGVFHRTMESIPIVSTVYASVRQASDILVDDDTDQFQEVKLVEFPHEDAYVIGFLTADTPSQIEGALDAESMQTLMVPLGPNPTTNGFILHMPTERVHDVDMTVEEAIRSIATLGVDSPDDDD